MFQQCAFIETFMRKIMAISEDISYNHFLWKNCSLSIYVFIHLFIIWIPILKDLRNAPPAKMLILVKI